LVSPWSVYGEVPPPNYGAQACDSPTPLRKSQSAFKKDFIKSQQSERVLRLATVDCQVLFS